MAGFSFLFRIDRGTIDRGTWWRGTVPLAAIALVATLLWHVIGPYLEHGLERPPMVVLGAYLYLLVFSFGVLIMLVCEYNLSAKRFAAIGRPRALAAVLPLSLLGAGAFAWYLPRSQDALPPWTAWIVVAILAGVVVWNVVELGIRTLR